MDELLIAQKENLGIDNFLENAKVYVEDLNLRGVVAEKIIMEELLNADDFNILLKTIQVEFERTFSLHSNEEEKEIE